MVLPLPGSELITINLYAVGSGHVALIDTGMKMPGAPGSHSVSSGELQRPAFP